MTVARAVPAVHWPVLELLFDLGTGTELTPLVRSLAEWSRPTAPDHTVTGAARLLSSPFAPEAAQRHERQPLPCAVVVRTADEVDHPVSRGATCLVAVTDEAAEAAHRSGAGDRLVRLSPLALRTREVLPVMPALRESMRRSHGLPDHLVVAVGRPYAPPLDDELLATALRLAAVADVCGPVAVQAMALGTPVVTDAPTAGLLGADHDVHLLVADTASAPQVAAELAADPVRCALLGRAGRRLVEERHDTDRTARTIAEHLGLPRPSLTPAAPGLRLGDRLAELGTPTAHPIELQVADRLAALGVAPRTVGSLP